MITSSALVFLACLVSIFSIGIHILMWRYLAVTPSNKKLILVLVIATLLQYLIFLVYALVGEWEINLGITSVLLSVSLAIIGSYIASYPAIQADSPTFLIASHILKYRSKGISRKNLYAQLDQSSLVADRIADLVKDKLVVSKDATLEITPSGRKIAQIFIFWRKILKEGKGG